jgi:nitrite reductase/ring-hydroxylating ferredoxin subunit
MVKYRVSDHGVPREGERIHTRINNRYITIFRNKDKLSVIDSICHHAGGPLTLGALQEIEDLGFTTIIPSPLSV